MSENRTIALAIVAAVLAVALLATGWLRHRRARSVRRIRVSARLLGTRSTRAGTVWEVVYLAPDGTPMRGSIVVPARSGPRFDGTCWLDPDNLRDIAAHPTATTGQGRAFLFAGTAAGLIGAAGAVAVVLHIPL